VEAGLMRIGVLSDSHDRLPAIAEFARRFSESGVGLVIHAGDFCSPFALRPLIDARLALAGVFGHNDGDREGLRAEAARAVGAELYESPHSVELDGVRVMIVHDLGEVQQRSVDEHALVIHGHTHRAATETRGASVLVNPGEACGWLYGAPTAAILDLVTKQVELVRLEGAEWTR
jgi:putative phosphoesterase